MSAYLNALAKLSKEAVMRRQSGRRVAVVAVALGLLAGCGGGNGSDSAPEESPTSTAADDARGEDQAAAERIVLKLSDFAPEWQEVPDEVASDDRLGGCTRTGGVHQRAAVGYSPQFKGVEGTGVGSSAWLFDGEDSAVDAFTFFDSEKFRTCVKNDVLDNLADPVEDISIGSLASPAFGESTAAWQMRIDFESEGDSFAFYTDLITIRQGRAVAMLTFVGGFTAFDQHEEERLSRIVAERMPA